MLASDLFIIGKTQNSLVPYWIIAVQIISLSQPYIIATQYSSVPYELIIKQVKKVYKNAKVITVPELLKISGKMAALHPCITEKISTL